jgi:hypothetical protein
MADCRTLRESNPISTQALISRDKFHIAKKRAHFGYAANLPKKEASKWAERIKEIYKSDFAIRID